MPAVPADRQPYPDPDRPGVYRVPLSSGHFALIDAADAGRVGAYVWSWSSRPRADSTGYAYHPGLALSLARFIACDRAGEDVGHRDDDQLNCRRGNLVVIPRSVSAGRSRKWRRPTSSQFKGVNYHRSSSRWVAGIRVDGRRLHLGRFRDESAAAAAYDRAALEHFGPLARVNFPDPPRP